MKKITFFTVFAIFIYYGVTAQTCLPDGITITKQSEIDNFQTNYPNCTEIEDACETLSVDENYLSGKLYIYPNPSSSQITNELPNTPQNNAFIGIQNMNGLQFLTQPIISQKTEIDIGGLPVGIYYIKVADDRAIRVGKLVKN